MNSSMRAEAMDKIHEIYEHQLRRLYDLKSPLESPDISTLYHVLTGIIFGTMNLPQTGVLNRKSTVVIGGPCICYCQANIKKITVQDIADILIPLLVAAHLQCPGVIYFQTYEAIVQQTEIDQFRSSEKEWEELYHHLRKITQHLMSLLNLPAHQVEIISTFEPKVKSCLDEALAMEQVLGYLTPDFLYGMYSINNQSLHPKGGKAEELFINIYRRNLATYLPIVVGRITGREFPDIVVVENCTQLKTSYKAEQLQRDLFGEKGGRISHLAYISTPGTSGREMYQCFPRQQIRLDTSDDLIRKRLRNVDEFIQCYFDHIWPPQITDDERQGTERFIAGFNNIRKVLDR